MECPEIHPDPCHNGRDMVLKHRRAGGSPFYVCDCKPAHFRNPEKEWTTPGGQGQGASGSTRTGASAKVTAQFCCAACGVLNDLEVTAYAVGQAQPEPRQGAATSPPGGRGQAPTGDRPAQGSTGGQTKPQPQNRGGYDRY